MLFKWPKISKNITDVDSGNVPILVVNEASNKSDGTGSGIIVNRLDIQTQTFGQVHAQTPVVTPIPASTPTSTTTTTQSIPSLINKTLLIPKTP